MSTKETGDKGENLACEYFVKNGYKIIGRNHRIKFGEIDIIARKRWGLSKKNGKTIHFVEVKTSQGLHAGRSEVFSPEDRANWKKKRKLKQLAEIWLQANKYPQDIPYQIDVIAVSINEADSKAEGPDGGRIDFFENVVEA